MPPAGTPRARRADAVRAAARLARVAGAALADADLTLAQYRVLVFLEGGDRLASDVAALLDVVPSTVTSVVDGLCGRGLVARGQDPTDRRCVVLSLTAAGRTQVTEGDRVVAERLGRLLDRLPDDKAEGALVGLESLNTAMEAYLTEKFGDPGGQK
ncbi:MAG: winged helix-turn-helix transcriptional regulator [Actinomycetia bacterium]|nr:winged helix-turn-helix transcriptional regulator [Actinomycetes bacterium]